jgi:hypothetical protein
VKYNEIRDGKICNWGVSSKMKDEWENMKTKFSIQVA